MTEPEPETILTTPILTSAIESLSPVHEILCRFHHRNKNQHRIAKWWAQADMLRRHTGKFIFCLENALEEAERLERIGSLMKRKKKKTEKRKREEEEEEEIKKRAGYLRWGLGPGCFLAFTQLAADRQFAHLGLMLLGVLAQVDQACVVFAPDPSPVADDDDDDSGVALNDGGETGLQLETVNRGGRGAVTEEVVMSMEVDADMGVAISREVFMAEAPPQEPPKKTKTDQSPSISKPRQPEEEEEDEKAEEEPKPKKKMPKVVKGDEFDDIFGSFGDNSPQPTKRKTAEKKKTKPKVVKADEFDDIFGSFGDDTPQPAKKKKEATKTTADEKSEEFDNIFDSKPKKKPKKKPVEEEEAGEFDSIFDTKKPIKKKQKYATTNTVEEEEEEFEGFFDKKEKKAKSTEVPAKTAPTPALKKKKRKKGGDEFDDIFGGF
ncbi:hypothetical protein QBC35DRAFT_536898 [Podospora australis]|uniref:RNase MRP protein 1 RNA binding domain-containing protein n=1 Tax=Podospora australis TaxID=1536484 RepID=A0AAN6X7P5_9PEZI|nr:hypothetical protein QBC35DRAFT_536898 [Podospora australis]